MNDDFILPLVSFALGNLTGFFIHKYIAKRTYNIDDEVRKNILIFIVSFAWILSVIIDIVSLNYETSPLIHGIMGGIVGYFFYKPGRKENDKK